MDLAWSVVSKIIFARRTAQYWADLLKKPKNCMKRGEKFFCPQL